MTPAAKAAVVRSLAASLGFDRVGITRAGPVPRSSYYRSWLAAGHAGSMTYLARNVPIRENPAAILTGARSVICAAMSYRRDESADRPARPGEGRVARYARGEDYHVVLRGRLDALVRGMRARLVGEHFDARVCVDTAPLAERELAAAAGVGWIGKNTLVIDERLGSYLVLGEIVTTLDLEPDRPVTDHCGSCTRCLDACPTNAFPGPYRLDASRCIAYLTIEHRGEIPAEFHESIGERVFGCDVCQEVCPFNAKAPPGRDPRLTAERLPAGLDLLALLRLSSEDYRALTAGSAVGRARRNMLRRNAAVALGSAPGSRDPAVAEALGLAAGDEDAPLRAAARLALARLEAPRRGT